MPLIKATNFFQGRQHGWTESYFYNFTTNDLSDAYQQIALPILRARVPMLGFPCASKAVRVSVERDDAGLPVLRDSYLVYIEGRGSQAEPAAEQDCSLQVIWQNATSQKRKFIFLRGVWDSIEGNNGEYQPSPAWDAAFLKWAKLCIAKRVGWDSRVQGNKAIITGYVSTATSFVTFTLGTPLFGAAPPNNPYPYVQVRVSKLNGKSVLNGLLTVLPSSPTSCTIVNPIAAGPFISSGVMTLYNPLFVEAPIIRDQKIVTRRVGAPLLESRGRRKAKPKV